MADRKDFCEDNRESFGHIYREFVNPEVMRHWLTPQQQWEYLQYSSSTLRHILRRHFQAEREPGTLLMNFGVLGPKWWSTRLTLGSWSEAARGSEADGGS